MNNEESVQEEFKLENVTNSSEAVNSSYEIAEDAKGFDPNGQVKVDANTVNLMIWCYHQHCLH